MKRKGLKMIETRKFTEEEQKAIDELKRRTIHEFPPRMLEDETVFYRFLKARDFKLKHAEDLLRRHIAERKVYEFEKVIEDYTPPEHLPQLFPSSFLGYDKDGFVIRYIDLGGMDVKGFVNVFETRQVIEYIIDYLEKDIERMTMQTKKLGKPITQIVHIMNLDKLTLFSATSKKGLELAMAIAKFYQDNYPERNKAMIFINASFYFNIAFKIVKTVIADGLLQKIHIFGRSGWQEVLLDVVDADELPAFLGGNRTDPDGNPLCNSFIVHGTKVPEELYLKKNKEPLSQKAGAKKLTISSFSSSEIVLNVCEPNTHIEWEFETKARDIAFGLYYKSNSMKKSEMEELIQKHRINTNLTSETGVYRCNHIGTYIIIFDNSYSWIHSKEVYYLVRLVKPHEQRNESNSN